MYGWMHGNITYYINSPDADINLFKTYPVSVTTQFKRPLFIPNEASVKYHKSSKHIKFEVWAKTPLSLNMVGEISWNWNKVVDHPLINIYEIFTFIFEFSMNKIIVIVIIHAVQDHFKDVDQPSTVSWLLTIWPHMEIDCSLKYRLSYKWRQLKLETVSLGHHTIIWVVYHGFIPTLYQSKHFSEKSILSVGEALKGKVSAGDIPCAVCGTLCCDKEY